MSYSEVRVFSKGNKYNIEFVLNRPNLLVKLLILANKNTSYRKSLLGDNSMVFVPTDEIGFVGAMNNLDIDNDLKDYKIDRYYLNCLVNGDTHTPILLSFERLITIAAKRYSLPDYRINRLTSACLEHRMAQIEKANTKVLQLR